MEEYSKRVYNNQIVIRPADSGLAKQIDEDPNSLHYYAFTDANMGDAKAVISLNLNFDQLIHLDSEQIFLNWTHSAQGKYKLYPLPQVNFCVAYYEVHVDNLGPDEP